MDHVRLEDTLASLAREYPPDMVEKQLLDIPRIAFHIRLVLKALGPRRHADSSLCDLGGGIGLFSVGCAAAGFKRVVLVDDFSDAVNRRAGGDVLVLHKRRGVDVVSRDVVGQRLLDTFTSGFDVVTSFDSMEHWHHSPKQLFHDVAAGLRPGGVFILGAPNCVNMRKRITVPLGHGSWSAMRDWYDEERFRGHVREPDVRDLEYIATDMGLDDVRIYGRNWLGHASSSRSVRVITGITDRLLRLRPSLCSDIYLVGKKRSSQPEGHLT